eukprot:TRINITY_DN94556_c0_g1_i1.p1 TRINITY_DN94556_c0_g1~~TRINITY_DN94556_c0_g1_i1.p1  ORF type:complete len:134 (-),score=26.78 TRINITY_DN94556_c0_g1_i1:464-865(-)
MSSKRAIAALVKKQKENFPHILDELRRNGRKTTHWVWWVFPTEMPGACEPGEETFVTKETVPELFKSAAPVQQWQEVLELICELVEEKGMSVLPAIDHGRLHYFLKFWTSLQGLPDWMMAVLDRLSEFNWPPR